MKTRKLLLSAVTILFLALQSFAQGYNVSSLNLFNSNFDCDSTVTLGIFAQDSGNDQTNDFNLLLQGSNFTPNSNIQMVIQWGDGTTSTHVGYFSGAGFLGAFNPPLQHTYGTTSQNYIAIITVYGANGTSAIYTLPINFESTCPTSVFTAATIVCPGVSASILNSIPVIFTSGMLSYDFNVASGQTINAPNLPEGVYTVTVSPNWLAANGLANSSQNIYQINYTGSGTITLQFIFDCADNASQTPVQTLISTNCNDVDPSILANIPLILTSNTNVTYNITVAHGQTVFVQNIPEGVYVVNINPAWLAQNGLINSQPNFTVVYSGSGVLSLSFYLLCDPNAPALGCVSGYVFCDNNNNGNMSSEEMGIANVPVLITLSNGTQVTVYTNANGYFSYTDTMSSSNLNQAVIVQIDPIYADNSNISFPLAPLTSFFLCAQAQPLFFPANCSDVPACADLWSTVLPWIGYFQNQNNQIKIQWGNYGPNAPGDYTLTLVYPADVTPITSTIMNPNYTIVGNSIVWTLNSASTNFSFLDIISFAVPAGIASGTIHEYNISISTADDCNSQNNYGDLSMFVGNSYDPNDKTVDLPMVIAPNVDDVLTYRIRFQNTGTAPAQDVYIMDTLSANLNWSTMQIVGFSHPMELINYGDGIIKFNFPDIWLPDSTANEPESHGYVLYRIQENANNGLGTTIENTAHIFFDWNEAIVTNTTYNINDVSSSINELNTNLVLYPNPTQNVLNVSSSDAVTSISIVDLTGKIVQQTLGSDIKEIDLSGLVPGVYLVHIQLNGQFITQRIVKQ
jgi:uncharacterized repeat protein (TIGR01451 family)